MGRAEKSIIFSAPMVRAILEGRKTQTRRLVKPQPDNIGCPWVGEAEVRFFPWTPESVEASSKCPYPIGTRLWVREKWMHFGNEYHFDGHKTPHIKYADGEYLDGPRLPDEMVPSREEWTRWRPPIHMPRWASRIDLEVTGVRVERVQAITLDDCAAEGAPPTHPADNVWDSTSTYAALWDKINGNGSWDSNPWVWVYEFRRIKP